MMTGAMFMAECLQHEGVTKVFGQCGHTNYALIDACHKLGIDYVSFRHEQMAAHAADAYFRVTHKLAVLNVHISPGMTNALTGVVTAAADCTPMVVIAGNTPSYHHAREPHQGIRFHADASQGDIYRPICKRVWRVDDVKFLHDVMPRALNVAQTGRPGAVLLDIPMDVFSAHVEAPEHAHDAPARGGRPDGRGAGSRHRRGRAAGRRQITGDFRWQRRGALRSRRRAPDPRRIARRSGRHDAHGQRHFPEDHSLACGMSGIWGTRVANESMREADVRARGRHGVRRSGLQLVEPGYTFAIPPTRLIQIDIDPQEIGKIYPVEIGLVGDARTVLRQLNEHLQGTRAAPDDVRRRESHLNEARQSWQAELTASQNDDGVPIHPARLLQEIARSHLKTHLRHRRRAGTRTAPGNSCR